MGNDDFDAWERQGAPTAVQDRPAVASFDEWENQGVPQSSAAGRKEAGPFPGLSGGDNRLMMFADPILQAHKDEQSEGMRALASRILSGDHTAINNPALNGIKDRPEFLQIMREEAAGMKAPDRSFGGKFVEQVGRGGMDVVSAAQRAVHMLPFVGNEDTRNQDVFGAQVEGERQAFDPAQAENFAGKVVLGGARGLPMMAGGAMTGPLAPLYWTAVTVPDAYQKLREHGFSDDQARIGGVAVGAVVGALMHGMELRGGTVADQVLGEVRGKALDAVVKTIQSGGTMATIGAGQHGAEALAANVLNDLTGKGRGASSEEARGAMKAIPEQFATGAMFGGAQAGYGLLSGRGGPGNTPPGQEMIERAYPQATTGEEIVPPVPIPVGASKGNGPKFTQGDANVSQPSKADLLSPAGVAAFAQTNPDGAAKLIEAADKAPGGGLIGAEAFTRITGATTNRGQRNWFIGRLRAIIQEQSDAQRIPEATRIDGGGESQVAGESESQAPAGIGSQGVPGSGQAGQGETGAQGPPLGSPVRDQSPAQEALRVTPATVEGMAGLADKYGLNLDVVDAYDVAAGSHSIEDADARTMEPLPTSLVFSGSKNGRSFAQELKDALPEHLRGRVMIKKSGGKADGEDIMQEHGVDRIVQAIIADADPGRRKIAQIRKLVDMAETSSEQIEPHDLYSILRYKAMTEGTAQQKADAKAARPASINPRDLNVGDSVQIVGHNVKVTQKRDGRTRLENDIKLWVPDERPLMVDQGQKLPTPRARREMDPNDLNMGDKIMRDGRVETVNDISPEDNSVGFESGLRVPGDKPMLVDAEPPPSEPPPTAEATGPEPSQTAIHNKAVDAYRQQRGLSPLMTEGRLTEPEVWDAAMRKVDANPRAADELVASLKETPRTIEGPESALLLHRTVELKTEHNRLLEELTAAYDAKDDARAAELEASEQRVSQSLDDLEDVARIGGTKWGQAGRFRQMVANDDYTLSTKMMQARRAKGGEPLTEAEKIIVRDLQKKVADTQTALDAALKAADETEIQKRVDAALAALPKAAAAKIPKAGSAKRAAAKAEVDAVWKELESEFSGKLFSNPLDPAAIAKFAKLAKAYAKLGIVTLQEFMEKVAEKIGPERLGKSREVFEAAWRAARGTPTKVNADKPRSVSYVARKIAKNFIAEGVEEREPLIDAVHGAMQKLIPGFTRRQTMDAISYYGQYTPLSKNAIDVKLRENAGEMQKIAQIEDYVAKGMAEKTGHEQRTPTAEETRLTKLVNEAKKKYGIEPSDPDTKLKSALATEKTRLINSTAEIEEMLAAPEFAPRPKREPIKLDSEGTRLKLENQKAREKLNARIKQWEWERKSGMQRLVARANAVRGAAQSIQLGMEFSFVGMQGVTEVFSHPVDVARRMGAMFKAWGSEHAAFVEAERIANDPLVKSGLTKRAKLALTEAGGPMSRQEELYITSWGLAAKIPILKNFERAAVTFLNRTRLDRFREMMHGYGADSEVQAKAIANAVNVWTGRGNLGWFEPTAAHLASVFLAPKWVVSRFQTILGQPLWHGDMKTKGIIAKEYARQLVGIGAMYALAAAGFRAFDDDKNRKRGHFEFDPRSANFGKIRVGETWIDPLGGLSQATVLMTQLGLGEKKYPEGDVVPLRDQARPLDWFRKHPLGKVPFGKDRADDVLKNFIRYKLAPLPGLAWDVVKGSHPDQSPVTPLSALSRLFVPINFGDIYHAMKSEGFTTGTALSLLNLFGKNLQTYQKKAKKAG